MPDGTLTINIIILFMEENLLIKRYNIKVQRTLDDVARKKV